MTSADLPYTPATTLAAEIRAGSLSPVEVVDALLERIERVNPAVNAFTVVLADEARAAARRAEAAVRSGDELGPLHGVPFLIKDLTATKGVKTMRGSIAFKDWVPEENGVVVERLLGAGGIFLGKTTTPELGNKGTTESKVTGTTNNPWNTAYTAGGSSGGSAAAVAAGCAPIAEGSDGAGSIRIPASICGVVGLKPSYGRVPAYPLSGGFALTHQGPIARTVADAALMLTVIAGPDDRDAYSIVERGVDYLEAIEGASVRGLRVAYSRTLGLGPVDQRVLALTDAAAAVFGDALGARVEEATPDLLNAEAVMLTMWQAQVGLSARSQLLPRVSRDAIDPAILALLEPAEKLSAFDIYQALFQRRGEIYQSVRRFFETYDLLLSPTLAVPPFAHPGWAAGPGEIEGQAIDPMLGWLRTYPFNMTGNPAISVPCGFTDDGLPVGLQIVARRHGDVAVLRAAAAYEAATPWNERRPAVPSAGPPSP